MKKQMWLVWTSEHESEEGGRADKEKDRVLGKFLLLCTAGVDIFSGSFGCCRRNE